MIDEIFPKSNYNFWRLTKTSYKPPGHQGQANLRSRHSASGVPIWNLWSRQRLPSPGVVLTHTHTGQSRLARGKKPEKNTSATASLDSSTEIEISLYCYPLESLGVTAQLFSHEAQLSPIQDQVLFLASWCFAPCTLLLASIFLKTQLDVWPSTSLAIFCVQH